MNTTQAIPAEWQTARRVLVVRLDNLGDVLVTTPAIRAIRQTLPAAMITLLASPVGAQAGRLNPDIDDVIIYHAPWMDPWQTLPQEPEREQQMIALLRERCFDGAIIFTSFRQSPLPAAYLCYLAGIPLRVAASLDGPGSLLTTRHKHPEWILHEVERGLDLVGTIGMQSSDDDLVLQVPVEAHTELHDYSLDPTTAPLYTHLQSAMYNLHHPLIVVHPGCSMPARTYPWDMYAELADLLIEQLGATVVLTGSAEEQSLIARIKGWMRHDALALAGQLSFGAFCALIESASLLITNNTGPMHIGAAVKTPVVALFALTNPPEQWGPWRVPHRLLYHETDCRLCYSRICPYGHECLRRVSPQMAVAAATELLATKGEKPAGLPQLRVATGCNGSTV